MKLFWSFLFIGMVIVVGCNQFNSSQTNTSLMPDSHIVKIQLTCTKVCQEMYPNQLKTIRYTDEETIQLFTEVMENVVKIQGILDYSVLYKMQITYEDKTVKNYFLNIEDVKDRKGLLVDEANSSVGYTIPTEFNNRLSLLIYKEK